MRTITKSPLAPTLVALFLIFLLFGGGAMSGGTMNEGTNRNVPVVERGWMWAPALFTLALGVVLGWAIVKKAV